MRAYTRWTDDLLEAELDGLRPMVRLDGGRVGRVPIGTFLAYLAAPERFVSSYGAMYLTDFYLKPDFGEPRRRTLAADAAFPLRRDEPCAEWISLYAGPAGTSTGAHQDIFSTHTWLALLRGKKAWRLWAPDADVERDAPEEIVLVEGDLIYLPPDWWHEVENRTSTLAISGNFCGFAHARAALEEARASDSPRRDVWIRTWEEILRGTA
jgi:hypothetical protein